MKISDIIPHIIGVMALIFWVFVFLEVKNSLLMLLIFITLFLMVISFFESISRHRRTPKIRRHIRKRLRGEYY